MADQVSVTRGGVTVFVRAGASPKEVNVAFQQAKAGADRNAATTKPSPVMTPEQINAQLAGTGYTFNKNNVDGQRYDTLTGPGESNDQMVSRWQQGAQHQQFLTNQAAAAKKAQEDRNDSLIQKRAKLIGDIRRPNFLDSDLAPIQTDADGNILESSIRPLTGPERADRAAAQSAAGERADADRLANTNPMLLAAQEGGSLVGGAFKSLIGDPLARVTRAATGQTGPLPDGNFFEQTIPGLPAANANMDRLAQQAGPAGKAGANASHMLGSLGSPDSLAMMGAPAALGKGAEFLKTIQNMTPVAQGVGALGSAAHYAVEATLPGAAVQGAQELAQDPIGNLPQAIGGLLPAALHAGEFRDAAKAGVDAIANKVAQGKAFRVGKDFAQNAPLPPDVEANAPYTSSYTPPEKGPNVLEAARTRLLKAHAESGGGMSADLARAFGHQLPETTQLAPDTAARAQELAGQRVLARVAMDQSHEGIKTANGGTEEGAQLFYDARDQGMANQRAKEYTEAATTASTVPGLMRNLDTTRGLLESVGGGVKEKFDALLKAPKKPGASIPEYQAASFARQTLMDAADKARGLGAWKGTPEEYEAYRQTPAFQESLDAWKNAAGAEYERSHTGNAGVMFGDEHGYFPSLAVREGGGPEHFVPTDSGPTVNDQNRGNSFATRLNEGGYAPTREAIEQHFTRTLTSNAQAALMAQAVQDGLATKLGRFDVNPTPGPDGYIEFTNPQTGEVVRAGMTATGPKFLTANGQTLPAERYVMPDWFKKEIQPIIDRGAGRGPETKLTAVGRMLNSASVGLNPSEMGSHMINQMNALEAFAPGSITDNPLLKIAEVTPFELRVPLTRYSLSPRKLVAAYEMKRIDLKSPQTQADIRDMARAGVLPDMYGREGKQGVLAISSNGLKAVDIRARLLMWRAIQRFEGQTGSPLPTPARYQVMRSLGIYSRGLEAGLERWMKDTGMNPFATAQFQQARNGFNQWKTLLGVDPTYAHLPKGQRLSAKAMAQLRGGPAKKLLAWYLTSKVMSSLIGPSKDDGKFMHGGGQLSSSLGRGPLGGAIAGGYNEAMRGGSIPEGAAVGAANAGIELPFGPVPRVAAAMATGRVPYFVPGKYGQAPEPIPATPKGVQSNVGTRMLWGALSLNTSAKWTAEHVKDWLDKPSGD